MDLFQPSSWGACCQRGLWLTLIQVIVTHRDMNRFSCYPLAAFFVSTSLLWSEPTNLEFDKLLNYESVRVTKITPAGITIMHKSGIARIPFADIPENIRKQLGLNADDAKAFSETEKARKAQLALRGKKLKLLKENKMKLHGKILELTKTGILLSDAYSANGETEKATYRAKPTRSRMGRIGGNGPGRKTTWTKELLKKTYYKDRFVHIECDNKKFVDGQKWEGVVYPAKKYRFAIDGVPTGDVMEAFQTDPVKFLEWKGLK